MVENQEQLDKAKQDIAERLGVKAEVKEVTAETKSDEVIDEKKEEVKSEVKTDEKKEDVDLNEEIDTAIKITAKQPETKEEEKKEETSTEDDIDEAKMLQFLSKKSGKEIKSLDEILNPQKEETEESKQKAKEQRDSAKVAYALEQGIITEKKLSKYFSDSKNKVDLVFEEYFQTESEHDKTLTKAQARAEFNERYSIEADEDTRSYKRGQKEINTLADTILRNEYPEVFELEKHYSEYENTINGTKQKEQSVLQKAPQYRKDVEDAITEIKSLKISRKDKATGKVEEYNIELDNTILEPYKNQALDKEYAEKQILNGWDKDNMKVRFQGAAILENIDTLIFNAIDKALLNREKGLKGVQPQKPFNPSNRTEIVSSQIEKAKDDIKSRLQGTPAATQAAN